MATIISKNPSNGMISLESAPRLIQLSSSKPRCSPKERTPFIGIYGVSGSGKTYLLNQLKLFLKGNEFTFYEGSQVIAGIVPGGLNAFRSLPEEEKMDWRERAIDKMVGECAKNGNTAVVSGHFMFWPSENEATWEVSTQRDLETYTHILYLDIPPEIIAKRREADKQRSRPSASITHLHNWQLAEKTQLAELCLQHRILFSLLPHDPALPLQAATMLCDFRSHNEEYNLSGAERKMDEIVGAGKDHLETMLVFDADRTLAAEDTGKIFWDRISHPGRFLHNEIHPLKMLFGSSLGYSYAAFRQAVLWYEEVANDQQYDALCQDVASQVKMYPEFVSLLHQVARQEHTGAVVISCGLRHVWDKVLEREGLSEAVKVIGGGRIADGFVVTAAVKAALVARLQDFHHMYVWAFGDSVLDLEMLHKADQAIVVVGEEHTRSKIMETALKNAIDNDGLQARQALLPKHASPRLDTTRIPIVDITDQQFIDSLFARTTRRRGLHFLHATEKPAAKLLMTPTRDATVSGPHLRSAHRKMGEYLAREYLGSVLGLEEHSIPHVQGHRTTGHRLLHEQQTLIVALMRGGEPMAFGVSEVFPLAGFLHAKGAGDVTLGHLRDKRTVVLVDSVVNSGKSVEEFVRHVRNLDAAVHIVVVAGVVQAETVSSGGVVQMLGREGKLDVVALRLSDNKFTGKGTTDTGNRLFNTTHLP